LADTLNIGRATTVLPTVPPTVTVVVAVAAAVEINTTDFRMTIAAMHCSQKTFKSVANSAKPRC
jgi:hypothetical protein